MKKVMISAYLNENLGDDLFIKILCERYPKVHFYIYGNKENKKTFKSQENLTYISSNFIFKIFDKMSLKLIKRSLVRDIIGIFMKANVYIGGSLFIQDDDWRKKIILDKNLILYGKHNFLIGCNFGPFKDKRFLNNYKKLFVMYDDVCFRDNKSYKLFKDLPRVRVAPDVVFSLNFPKNKQNMNNHNLGISVIDLTKRRELAKYKNAYLMKIKEICEYYIGNGSNVTLFSFCKNEGDERTVKEVIGLLNDKCRKKVNIISYRNDIDFILAKINEIDILFATRFHSMILGFLFGKLVFPIIYSHKMTNVLKDLNYSGSYCEISNIGNLNVKNIKLSTDYISNIGKIIEQSNQQFKELDRYLN